MAPGTDVAWPFTQAASTNGLARRVWGFQADYNNWLTQNLIPIPTDGRCYETDVVGAGTCLDGYLWHHARTPIGYTEPWAGALIVGVRGEDGRDLSNSFVPLAPDSPTAFVTKVVGKYRKLWWWQKLREPLAPFLDDPRPASHARLVGLDDDSSVLMVHDIGGGEEVGPHMSEDAQRSVAKYVVAASLEPEGSARQISKEVEGAVLSEDGTRVLDLLVSDAKSLRTGTENGWSVASEPSLDAPTPRTGFTAFFSPMLGAVVVAGGRDAAGSPDGSVYVYRFGIGWHRVRPDVEFVDVRAAIFSPADGMLWIVNAANETKVQIVRIDPLTGETGRAATFAWDPTLYPTHTLGLDSNGKVLLVASSTNTSKTMRLEVNPLDGKIRGTGLLQHEFPQSTPPVSAFGETSFVREDTAGQVVGIDRSHTIPIGATLSVAGMFK